MIATCGLGPGAGVRLGGPNCPLVSETDVMSAPRFSWSAKVEPVWIRPVRRSLVDGAISPAPENPVVESNCVPAIAARDAPVHMPPITAAQTNTYFCIFLSSTRQVL